MREIVVRAPLRVSFGGGGTDLPAYYERYGGLVLSAAITRYCYVTARRPGDGGIRISSADYRLCRRLPPGRQPEIAEPLALPRAAIAMFWGPHLLRHGVDLFLSAEAPPGTGLGSSSAMAVALVRALAAYQGASLEAREAAELACRLEIEQLGMPIGKQDQYASAFGGLNTLTFTARGVQVCPLHLEPATVDALRTRLLLFATGRSHRSPDILREQRARTGRTAAVTESLHALKALAGEMAAALRRGDLDGFGRLLDVSWQHKKRLSQKISSEVIDGWYRAAREAGALGGKITGAGGGGFLLLYCPPQAQPTVRAAMGEAGLRELSFSFDRDGARVLTAGAGKRALPAGTRRREENALHA